MATVNLQAIVRDLAADARIPETHVPAVIHRAERAMRAVEAVHGYPVLGRRDTKLLAQRVVGRAAAAHAAGVLEQRCAPR